jgi:hypothetical protein
MAAAAEVGNGIYVNTSPTIKLNMERKIICGHYTIKVTVVWLDASQCERLLAR